jgi:hypothetical protein
VNSSNGGSAWNNRALGRATPATGG